MGPVLLILVGALLLILGGQRLPNRLRHAAPTWLAGTALLLWLALRLQPAQEARTWLWRAPLGLDSAVGVQLDGWAWLAGAGIILALWIGVALPGWRGRPGFIAPRHWALVAASAALLVVLAHTWISLLAAWVFLSLSVGLVTSGRESGDPRAWVMGISSTFFLLAAALFNGGVTLDLPLGATALNVQAQLWLTLTALIALGAYPFHLWLTPQASRSPGHFLIVFLAPALAALHLLGRFELPLLASQAWVSLSAVALFGGALAAWADQNPQRAWTYVLINRSAWAVLALSLTRLSAPANVLAPLLTLILGGTLWAVACVSPLRGRWHIQFLVGAAILYGLPFTPGFAANLALSQLASTFVLIPFWLIVLLAQTLLVAALLRPGLSRPDPPGSTYLASSRLASLILTVVVILALWWGVFPGALAALAGVGADDSGGGFLTMVGTGGLLGLFTWLLPLALGVLLFRLDQRLFGTLRGWQVTIAHIAGLDWLYRILARGLHSLAASLGILADILDGAGQFGWALLAILLALILLRG